MAKNTTTESIYVATQVKTYGCTGEDPETRILCVGTHSDCVKAAETAGESLARFIGEPLEGDEKHGWRGVDDDENAAYFVEIHEWSGR